MSRLEEKTRQRVEGAWPEGFNTKEEAELHGEAVVRLIRRHGEGILKVSSKKLRKLVKEEINRMVS